MKDLKNNIIDYKTALKELLDICNPLENGEYISIENAVNRVCKEDIICQKNLPSFDNAALDGFAFKFEDKGKSLNIKTTIFAGDNQKEALKENECYKIMTGAKIPKDADTIAPFEICEFDEKSVQIPENISKFNAKRFKGEEQKKGNVLIKKDTLLSPAHIMLLASQGILRIIVHKIPKIAILSTGNEIKEPWQKAKKDEIYNANSFGILALFKNFGFNADYLGLIADDFEKTKNTIKSLSKYDLILTSGGASEGEADFIKKALLENNFKAKFDKVNLKPGKPTMAGVFQNSVFMALPGNPMAAFLNAFLFGIVAARKISGFTNPYHKALKARVCENLKLKTGRNNIILGTYENGLFYINNKNKFGSGMITPLTQINAIAITDTKDIELKNEDEIEVYFIR